MPVLVTTAPPLHKHPHAPELSFLALSVVLPPSASPRSPQHNAPRYPGYPSPSARPFFINRRTFVPLRMSRKLAPEANRILFVKNLKYVFTRSESPIPNGHEPGSIPFTTACNPLTSSLSYNVTADQLFDLFGKFGPIRQIRQGIANNSKGTAFVVYEDVHDAKQACDKLNGFNFQNRYLVVLYHQPEKMARSKEDLAERQENLERLKQQHGIE
ncbi:Nucleotide-binding alpha-beta plait [Penicillium lagena]|uniref:Nucleotide-binding alpha-beta plait n=1 Tax=Penicillium lagena TaxID=94218 RepID=UPI002542029F|nr:Nucleotide-binding alpha-beta plait [Penicillium lagena]KAJ5605844.1 Nucleotide-binding alpha-beta plait [Penicillium lagena]